MMEYLPLLLIVLDMQLFMSIQCNVGYKCGKIRMFILWVVYFENPTKAGTIDEVH